LVVVVEDAALPFKSRLLRLTEGSKAPRLLVIGRVTPKHLLVVELKKRGARLTETRRQTYQIAQLKNLRKDGSRATKDRSLELADSVV
jgi:hypothetical protein